METLLSLFNCCTTTVLSYASEMCGYHKGKAVETVHLDACKRVLGIKKSTNISMIYTEYSKRGEQLGVVKNLFGKTA